MQKIWHILKNSDMTEGRGPMISTGIAFTDQKDAIQFIEKQYGIMGCSGEKARASYNHKFFSANCHQAVEITVHSNMKSAMDSINESEKEKALSKLTSKEKELLGLC